jgi:type I restriction enzyme M protein
VKANVVFFDRRPGSEKPWTKTVWVYDFRTNVHFTLKTKRMTRRDLDEFVACYRPGNRPARKATWSEKTPDGRWRPYSYEEILARDKVSLDLFWLRDESLEDSANLPDPDDLAAEIAEDLRSPPGPMGVRGRDRRSRCPAALREPLRPRPLRPGRAESDLVRQHRLIAALP